MNWRRLTIFNDYAPEWAHVASTLLVVGVFAFGVFVIVARIVEEIRK